MLEGILGNQSAEKVLLFLQNYNEGFAGEIARIFNTPIYSIQKQLQRMENSGILVSRLVGRTRLYTWNPRFSLRVELQALIAKALKMLPESDQKKYFRERKRPRRLGKPL